MKFSYKSTEGFRSEVKIEHAGCFSWPLYYMNVPATGGRDVMLVDDFGNLITFYGYKNLVELVSSTHDAYH